MGGLSNQGLLDLITHLQSRECSIGKQPKTQPTGTEIFSVPKRKEKKMRELKNTELEDVAGGFIERRPIVYKIIDLVGKYLNQN